MTHEVRCTKHAARGTKHEARLLVTAMMVVCSSAALAMPTQQELKKAQPLVAELMSPTMDDFKAKKKTAADVADMAVKYAGEAETEAAKFMLYRSSIPYYVRGEAYDKAADAVTLLKTNVKDVPGKVIAEIISKATVRANREKAPRLFELYQQARTQATAEKDVEELQKKPASPANRRKLAEAFAMAGKWPEALKEFANLKDKTAQIAKKEQDGSGKSYELGEFWWAYEPACDNAEDTFKIHAAVHYRKALAAGEITGLKKNIVEQRIKEYGDAVAVAGGGVTPIAPKQVVVKQLTHAGYLTKDHILLWEGVSVRDIQGFTATMAGGHISHPGKTIGYVVDSGDGWKSVQFQFVDGENGQNFLKCVYARFEQRGKEVRGYVQKAAVADASVAIGTDFKTVKSAKEYYLCFKDDGGGYGIKDLVVSVGGKGAAASTPTTKAASVARPTGSIELKTGGDSPFTVKGNEATLTLKSGVKLEFVKCPSGWVKVVDDYEKKSTRKVKITRPFWIMKRCLWKDDAKGVEQFRDSYCENGVQIHPAFSRIEGFCSDLTDDLKAVIPAGYVVRLPSIAEWEYAYLAGSEDSDDEPFGSLLRAHDWGLFNKHGGKTPVNKWGLCDFHVVEKILDRVNPQTVNVFEKEADRVVRLPANEQNDDLFYWGNDLTATANLVRLAPWQKLRISKDKVAGSVRLVIGPDLVSEWKAKNGKK